MSSKIRLESAATEAVQKNGLKSLSFRTLGAEVGVKSSSVHYHFPEKSDLAQALIDRYRTGLCSDLKHLSANSESAYSAIAEFVGVFIGYCNEGKLCLGAMLASESELLTQANRESLTGVFNEMQVWLTDEFERGRDELTVDLPSRTLAHCLLSSLEGAHLIARNERSDDQLLSVKMLLDSWFSKVN